MSHDPDVGRDPQGGDEEALRQVAENVREIFWILDRTGSRLLYVNPAYETITGRSIRDTMRDPASWRETVHPEDRARLAEIMSAGECDIELRIVRPDGGIRWLWVRGGQVPDRHGEVSRIVGVAEDITRRKRAEDELEQALAMQRATLDATADGILALDVDGRLITFNRRFSELWRIPESLAAEAGDEKEFWSWLRDQVKDPAAFDAEMARVTEHPETNTFDVIEFKDGRVFERYSQPERIADRITGRVWSFRDVTARTNAERALRHRTRRIEVQDDVLLRLARRHIADLADRQSAFEAITEAAAKILETERVGIWLFEAGHTRIRLYELYQRSAQRHSRGTVLARELAPSYFSALERERTIAAADVHTDARTRELAKPYCAPLGITSMLDAPIRAGGELMGIVCFEHVGIRRSWSVEDESFAASIADLASIAIEAADREQDERRMRSLVRASEILASSLDYRTTLTNVARLVVEALADWCIVDVIEDARIRRAASAHAKQGKEQLVHELMQHYPMRAGSPQLGAIALRTGKPQLVTDATDEMLRKHTIDERHFQLARALGVRSYLAVPLKARGGTLGVLSFGTLDRNYGQDDLLFAQEIANRAAIAIDNARLHAQAQQASKAKSDFLAVMSHELRTPLAAIMGYTNLLEEGVRGPVSAQQKEALARVRLRSQDLLRILEEILTFARTEGDREVRRDSVVDVAHVIREVEAIIRPLAEERGLELDIRGPHESVTIVTDPDKLRHILLNLLSNAVKFTEHGRIALDYARQDESIVFRVSDTGQGIAKADQERIFEPFAQVEDALTREKGGTGLGLAVARRLARFLWGDVTVTSKPGKGSTFTVQLPATPDHARDTDRTAEVDQDREVDQARGADPGREAGQDREVDPGREAGQDRVPDADRRAA